MANKTIKFYGKLCIILAFFSLCFLALKVDVSAVDCPGGTVFCGEGMGNVLDNQVKGKLTGVAQSRSLIEVIMGWIQFFLPYAGLLAFGGIVYAGFLYLTGFASEDNIGKAKNILIWSVIGLILIFISYSIVSAFIRPNSGTSSGGSTTISPPAPPPPPPSS